MISTPFASFFASASSSAHSDQNDDGDNDGSQLRVDDDEPAVAGDFVLYRSKSLTVVLFVAISFGPGDVTNPVKD